MAQATVRMTATVLVTPLVDIDTEHVKVTEQDKGQHTRFQTVASPT